MKIDTRCRYSEPLKKRLNILLSEAEFLYGPRNPAYTIMGVKYSETGPFTRLDTSGRGIWIYLNNNKTEKLDKGTIFELAHEVVHCLDPATIEQTLLIEEGMACVFSQKIFPPGLKHIRKYHLYEKAYELAKKMMKKDKHIFLKARNLRPHIYEWTPDFLMSLDTNISSDDAKAACVRPAKEGWYRTI